MIAHYDQISIDMVDAVREACKVIKSDFENACLAGAVVRNEKAQKNGLPDFVTDTDQKAENTIRSSLSKSQPNINFVGEECGGDLSQQSFFLVDPLDGTSNFASLRDYFSVCAAYVEKAEVKVAVIANPMTEDVVYAVKGQGTHLNGVKVDLDDFDADTITYTQLECEMPFAGAEDFSLVGALLPHMSGMRKSGSTALDILNLIKGRNIICLSGGLEPHDIAPCGLIVSEANGLITGMDGRPIDLGSRNLIAGPKQKCRNALAFIKKGLVA